MKKISLKQWILVASVFALGFSCQSKKASDSTEAPNTQCEESSDGDDEDTSPDDGDDEMSNLLQIQTEEKVSIEPVQEKESSSLEQKQEESAPAPALTESAAPDQLSIQDIEFVPEIDLETLAKVFSIETEVASEAPAVAPVLQSTAE